MNSSKPNGLRRFLTGLAVTWALFQLALPQFIILDHITTRAVHLMFALILSFMFFPFKRQNKVEFDYKNQGAISWYVNGALALIGGMAILYIVIDWNGIAMRSGSPLVRDLMVGGVAVILLMEASRRVIGPALACVAILFTLFAFLGYVIFSALG